MSEAGKRLIAAAKRANEQMRRDAVYQDFVYELASELVAEAWEAFQSCAAREYSQRNFRSDLAEAFAAILKQEK